MTSYMKKWLNERGLTAMQVAEKAGLYIPTDIYRQLNGSMPVSSALRETLIGVYGMTAKEYQEAIP